MSELSVGQLKGLTVNNNIISVPSGHTMHVPGSLVQVVSQTTTLGESTSVDGLVTSGYYIAITPKFITSRFLVSMNFVLYKNGGAGGVRAAIGRTIGGGTLVDIFTGSIPDQHNISFYSANANEDHTRVHLQTIDSPSSLQEVRYYVRYGGYNSGVTYLGNGRHQGCNFTIMEIAQ
jgi:hypothetical protein